MRALQTARRHLAPSDYLVVDIFDPKLERCLPRVCHEGLVYEAVHAETGCCWKIFVDSRKNNPAEQLLHAEWRLVELAEGGQVLNQYYWHLTLRWSYRFEMQHLFERSGFHVVNLWSDYQRSPFTYGQRQVWLVEKSYL